MTPTNPSAGVDRCHRRAVHRNRDQRGLRDLIVQYFPAKPEIAPVDNGSALLRSAFGAYGAVSSTSFRRVQNQRLQRREQFQQVVPVSRLVSDTVP